MNKKSFLSLAVVALGALGIAISCNNTPQAGSSEDSAAAQDSVENALLAQAQNLFQPLPEAASFDRPIAKLGKKLYYENELSVSGEMSCNTCHMLDKYGVDNEPTSLGHDKKVRGERNSPSTYNAYFHVAQFWDGRAADLTEQAKGPVLNPVEMGMPDEETVLKTLSDKEVYKSLFAAAFPEDKSPITFHNMAVAIAEFEKTLATPGKWDQYLGGKKDALSEAEKEGLQTFIQVGCITCHTGPGLGGQIYQKFGLMKGPYWEYTGSEKHDEGRFEVTGNALDKNSFKVPALRNVAETSPYFHDGSVADLGQAIKIMGTTQLGKELSEEQVTQIKTFLEALTGEIPEHALQKPTTEVASL
jgi:cytochrome c peroxidase